MSDTAAENHSTDKIPTSSESGEDKVTDAGIIIIGDEILKGHCKDTNSAFLLSHLWSNGITVRKVSFISDNVNEIAKEVCEFSSKYSFVITTGGIGPTHDDMTFQGVATAFNETLVLNSEIERMILEFVGGELSPALMKMAMVPKSTILSIGIDPVTQEPVKYPLLSVGNVFIFPGIPEYLKKLFIVHKDNFSSNSEFLLIKVYLSCEEEKVADVVENVSKTFSTVHVGSYPTLNDTYKVKVTLECANAHHLSNAYASLINQLPKESIISVKKCSPNSRDAPYMFEGKRQISVSQMNSLSLLDIEYFLGSDKTTLSSAIKCAWAVFNQTFQLYSFDEVCISFNGGKDCTVILHLLLAFMKKVYPNYTEKIKGLYIKPESPFEGIEHFIDSCQSSYNIDVLTMPGSIHICLDTLSMTNSKIKAIIMGNRRQDPYSAKLRAFSMTDDDWPRYMRVFPILDWSYSEVWEFLRTLDLPYCNLYNEGYTSLGTQLDTQKNPDLCQQDNTYLPAYMLSDESRERAGRVKK